MGSELENPVLRYSPMALLIFVLVAVPIMASQAEGVPRYRALRRELSDLRAGNEQLRREISDREREVQSLKTDLGTVERIARDELGMIRQGEVVLQFE